MGRQSAFVIAALLAGVVQAPLPVQAQESGNPVTVSGEAGPIPARPLGQAKWAAQIRDAYPSESGVSGTVGLTVTVSPEGRATECVVTATSGHPVLDDAACRGMLTYSRFTPARDANGEAVPGTFTTRITYRYS
jgi:protein TonB